jgi:hypothetical protein
MRKVVLSQRLAGIAAALFLATGMAHAGNVATFTCPDTYPPGYKCTCHTKQFWPEEKEQAIFDKKCRHVSKHRDRRGAKRS